MHFCPQYQVLFSFDTEFNTTTVAQNDPSFIWGKQLPNYKPDKGTAHKHKMCLQTTDTNIKAFSPFTSSVSVTHDIIVTVLAVTVVVITTIAFIFYRSVCLWSF